MTEPIYPCLWFDGQAKAAAEYYVSVFKNSKIISESPIVVIFELDGRKFMALNGGAQYKPSAASSYVVSCRDQEEIDYFWNALTRDGGQESMCGWVEDKFGYSWQIIPHNIGQLITKQSAVDALMKMRKIIITDLK